MPRAPSSWIFVLAVLVPGGLATADEGPIARPEAAARAGALPDIASPIRLRAGCGRLGRSLWTAQGLWQRAPGTLPALAGTARSGAPSWDPQSRAFFASAEGTVVELAAGGALRVLLDGVQGLDLDVRARRGLAVSREPDHRIVLHRTAAAARRDRAAAQQTLLSGERFFAPRFSPDGSRLLVAESRAEGGRIWLLELDGRATELGQGYDASWHPDGKEVVFARIEHDGSRLTAGDLFAIEVATRRVRCLARTPGLIEVEPVVSPDGRWLAFQDARGGDLYLARYPARAR
jgi:hypothetical protein